MNKTLLFLTVFASICVSIGAQPCASNPCTSRTVLFSSSCPLLLLLPSSFSLGQNGGVCSDNGVTFTCTCPTGVSSNLVTNAYFDNGFTGYTKVDGGSGWGISDSNPAAYASYLWGTLSQTITFSGKGYSDVTMDTRPQINFAVNVARRWVCLFSSPFLSC
jgi:hypothetical protein